MKSGPMDDADTLLGILKASRDFKGVKWDKRLSLIVEVLRMSLEVSFCEDKIDFTKYVNELLHFISKFHLSWTDACKAGSELPLEVRDNLQPASEVLELCCKTIWKHIKLLYQSYLRISEYIQSHVASKDLIKPIIKDAFTIYASIIDFLHKFEAANLNEVLNKSMSELYLVEVSFPNHSLYFPLMKQWVKILCKDFSDVDEVDNVPFLYLLLQRKCPACPMNILGEILEQELQAYDQLEAWNPTLCHKMEIKLAFAYFLRALFSQENKKDWKLIQDDIQCAINLLSKLDVEAYHTLSGHLKPSVKMTISILCQTLDLLSLKGFLDFHFNMHTLIKMFCKFENFSVEKCLVMLWTGRRLGHSLCTSPIDPDLISRISQLYDNNLNSFALWTEYLNSSSYSRLIFIQKILFSDSILNDEIIQQIEALYKCKLIVEGVKMIPSSFPLEDLTKNEMSFAAGHIYYNLAERLFACGRAFEGLQYAKKALELRYENLQKKFNMPSKRPVEIADSSTTNCELNTLYLELLGSTINGIWRDTTNLESYILSPWIILNCYLESVLQVGILHETIGDGVQAEAFFLSGKKNSIFHSLPYF